MPVPDSNDAERDVHVLPPSFVMIKTAFVPAAKATDEP